MPTFEFTVTVAVSVSERGANVNEILRAVACARSEFGVRLAAAILEAEQDFLRETLCGSDRRAKVGLGGHPRKDAPAHRCRCRAFVKEGFRSVPRTLKTDLGRVSFRLARVSCKSCGRKFAPLLDVLQLAPHQRHSGTLERLIVEAANKTAFARSVANVEGLCGVPVSKSASHRWTATVELPRRRPPPMDSLMVDGTRYKGRRRRRSELRVAIGLRPDGRVVPLGTWSGTSWPAIGRTLRRRLAKGPKAKTIVLDGELALSKHFAALAEREQRSHFHLLRDFRMALWQDGLKAPQWKPLRQKLAALLAIEIPEGEWEAILELEAEALRARVEAARATFQAMVDAFEQRGYRRAVAYLSHARNKLFSHIDVWLETGIITSRSVGVLEEIMRELGRRIKKLGWNWSDHGVTQQATMILLRRYSAEEWERYWQQRLGLRGRCQITKLTLERVA